jgi:hypothetical protein
MLCEKPPANSIDEAERMVQAARSAAACGVRSMVGYRRVPAVAFARRLVDPVALGAMACPVETAAASSREPPSEGSVRVDLVVRLVVFRRESCCCARPVSRSSVLRVRGSEASGIRRKYVFGMI